MNPDFFRDAEAALGRGDAAEAEESCRKTLVLEPNHIGALNLLGMILCQRKEYVEGISCFRRMVALDPGNPAFRCNLGVALQGGAAFNAAAEQLEAALALDPRHAIAAYNLANIRREQGQFMAPAELYSRALKEAPEFDGARFNLVTLLMNRGNLYMEQEDPDAALSQYKDALVLARSYPHLAQLQFCLGNAYKALGIFHEAKACYERSIELQPDFAEPHWNLANTLLLLGDFERGWKEFEWRHRLSPPYGGHRRFWKGEDLRGKTILVHAEQGFGDAIQFVRYAEILKKRGAAKVIVECLPELAPLLLSAPGVDQLAVYGDPTPEFDSYAMSMSLPLLLGRMEPITPSSPYLSPDSEAVRFWEDRLARYAGLKIGLAWAGMGIKIQPGAVAVDRKRSIPLHQFFPLREIPGVTFFSLQKGTPADQLRHAEFPMVDFMEECRDFSDTAALVANLDLVIAVDTSVAHLAGALGKPVWVLSRFDGCWRWLLERSESPWYPSARVFRQKRRLDWAPVIEEVAHELREATEWRLH